jgi:deferrochelatase/peroxidase EfeB
VNLPDRRDVQGLAAYGYGKLTEAYYLLLRIRNAAAARSWIGSAMDLNWVSTAEERKPGPETALQIAFTSAGMQALGLPKRVIAGFSTEFIYGMGADANRSRRLGDIGKSDPVHWCWGGPDKAVDLVVMLFACQDLRQWQATIQTAPWHDAFEIVKTLETSNLQGHEPFGFTDSISQPTFDWKREVPATENTVGYSNMVALGELLLGYPNEHGKYTDRPLLETSDDPADDLLAAEDRTASKDLGLNGTFFVLRQLEQEVRDFWRYLDSAAGAKPEERERLGACMVGRTLNGEPLIPSSGEKIAGIIDKVGEPRNSFTYDHDLWGTQCPVGAHIRRANPRNADLFGRPGPIAMRFNMLGIPSPNLRDDLMASTRFHRVLRRGREYGSTLTPEQALQPAPAVDPPRGLYFACLGANIARQFEFVQNAWLMSSKFNFLTEEDDPLLGGRAPVGDCTNTGNFSIPRDGKVTRRLTGIPQFITVRGGEYFFLPSLRALRYISRAR